MMKFKTNNMNNLIFLLFITSITFFSCKREKKEVIGPDLAIASSNFQVDADSFKFNYAISDFSSAGKNWFNASFNERVSWEIKIKGTQSKAYKIVRGTSDVLGQSTALWTGTHSGVYFFIAGEKAIAELSVNGSNKKWYDTTTIANVKGRTDYGPNALLWWDMDLMSVAALDKGGAYFNTPFYAGVDTVVQWGDIPFSDLNDPVQGRYRSMFAKSKTLNSFWVGGTYAGNISTANVNTGNYGFAGSSWNEVYLNFYIRRRTPVTPAMGISVTSYSGKVFVKSVFNPFPPPGTTVNVYKDLYTTVSAEVNWSSQSDPVGGWRTEPSTVIGGDSQLVVSMGPYPNIEIKGEPEGWKLVSIRLDQMTPSWNSNYIESEKLTFDPAKIVSVTTGLRTAELTGYDIDFIVFTRGLPFDQLMDQNP
jgi:hypothetical protein